MIVHQFTPILEPGAVGAHTLAVRDAFRAAGHSSEVFAADVRAPYTSAGARPIKAYRGGADALVYQMAIGSPVADVVRDRPEPLVVNHHNLTPLRYLRDWQPVAAHGVVWGRAQLRELAAAPRSVSATRRTTRPTSSRPATRAPPSCRSCSTSRALRPRPGAARANGPTTWLFVGRLAPNKAQHDIVKALAAYRQFHDPDARLVLVGGGADDAYGQALQRFVHALDLDPR